MYLCAEMHVYVCIYIYTYVCYSHLSIYLFVCLSAYLSTHLPIREPYLSVLYARVPQRFQGRLPAAPALRGFPGLPAVLQVEAAPGRCP